mgnify:CR=1 FL=1
MKLKKISPVVQKAVDHYVQQVMELNAKNDNQALQEYRQQAVELFKQQAFPTQRDEDWQYTRLTSFVQRHFQTQPAGTVTVEQINQYLPSFAVTRVVFIDGWFSERLSDDLSVLPKTASFETLADITDLGGDIQRLFAIEDEVSKEPFGLLNSALVTDGFYLQVQANSHIELPLFVLHVQTKKNQLSNTRNRIELEENSELTIVERFVTLNPDNEESSAFNNVVTQIDVGRHARCQQIVMQEQGDHDFYFSNQYIFQAEKSSFNSFFASVGSEISRHQNHLWMNGEHIESKQNSACLAKSKQVVDSRTDTQHNDVWGVSQQLHKYVLTETATGVFNGMIRVDQKAQKTDGQMDNKNLLLSDSAKMDTKPQLEIYADDVKCSHGSATGQIAKDQIFYLQARGIKRKDAIQMITHAFLLEPVESIANPAIRKWTTGILSCSLNNIQA